jgi:SagB-type dehydrogenase family enzyme
MTKPRNSAKKKLPAAKTKGGASLAQSLARRRSIREFTGKQLTDDELSQLLWATQGVTNEEGFRTAPSAGALYPLELYVAMTTGLYHYDPGQHTLRQRSAEDLRPALHKAALAQDPVLESPAVFVLTAVSKRTVRKYGQQRSPRYIHMEAGHAGQNLLLQATALGLGAVPIGAFEDKRVSKVLALPGNEAPLYLIPVGHAR